MIKIKKWMVIPYIPSQINESKDDQLFNNTHLSTNEKANIIKETLIKNISDNTSKELDLKEEELVQNEELVEPKNEILKTPEKPAILKELQNAPIIKRKTLKIIPSPKKGDITIDLNSDSFLLPVSKHTRNEKKERKKHQKKNRIEKFDSFRLNDFALEVDDEILNSNFETYKNNF